MQISTLSQGSAVQFGKAKPKTLAEAKADLAQLLKQQTLPYEVLEVTALGSPTLMVVVDQAEGKTDASLKAEVLNRLKPLPGFKTAFNKAKDIEEDTLLYNRFLVQISVSHKSDLKDLLD